VTEECKETVCPLVTVIIPTYNRARLLGRAIDSVLAQIFTDFELIIVDDGSVDNTRQLVLGYADQRIRYLRHERNQGANAARNTGVRAATGKYVAFLDSDDE
jgi:glycosyltransferase involved in cell wall biosynthesis